MISAARRRFSKTLCSLTFAWAAFVALIVFGFTTIGGLFLIGFGLMTISDLLRSLVGAAGCVGIATLLAQPFLIPLAIVYAKDITPLAFPLGRCQECGYDLSGVPPGRCPECGWESGGEGADRTEHLS